MMTPEQEYITVVYAVTDYDKCPLITPGYLYEVIEEDADNGSFRTSEGWQVWEKDGDIGFQDWERVCKDEEIPIGLSKFGFSEAETREVLSILRTVREKLDGLDRQKIDSERAAWGYYFAMGPRISVGDDPVDPVEHAASLAMMDAASYDAAKMIASELLIRGDQLPERMSIFISKVLSGEAERPKPMYNKTVVRGDTDLRDNMLIYALWRLEQLGIPVGKNPAKGRRGSKKADISVYGCQLVCRAIEDVMRNKGQRLQVSTLQELWSNKKGQDIRSWYDILPGSESV